MANECRKVLDRSINKRSEVDIHLLSTIIQCSSFYESHCTSFNPSQLYSLASVATLSSLTRNEVLYYDNNFAEHLYIVLTGAVSIKAKVNWLTRQLNKEIKNMT